MSKMKESGIPWIGEIPEHWKDARIGGLYVLRNTKVSDKEYPPLSVTNKGILPQLETVAKTNHGDDRKLVKKGDFVINSRSDRRGSCGIAPRDGSVSLINIVLAPRQIMNPQYYEWLFHSAEFSDEFYKWGHGIVDDLWTTNWQDMKRIKIPLPPLSEQRAIADYLDGKCGEIDASLELLEEGIQTLEAYKKSIIAEAVTHGLDSTVPMKECGIAWLGKIPEAWELKKGKYLFEQRSTRGNRKELQLLSPTQNYGVIPQALYDKYSGMSAVKLNAQTNLSTLKTIHRGDFCISLRSFQGGFEYSKYEGVVSPAYQVFYPIIDVISGYYRYLFKSSPFIEKINSYTISLRDGKNIAFADFAQTLIPLPPLAEQQMIADYLDGKCGEIEAMISLKRQQIEVLKEYKKSLIFEVVTGKREVRV